MYQQLNKIIEKVARSTESSFLAISAAQKSLVNIKENPRSLSKDEDDVLRDIEKTESMIRELEDHLITWIKKNELQDVIKFRI